MVMSFWDLGGEFCDLKWCLGGIVLKSGNYEVVNCYF